MLKEELVVNETPKKPKYQTVIDENEYSPIPSSNLISPQPQSSLHSTHVKLVPKRLDQLKDDLNQRQRDKSRDFKVKPINSKDIINNQNNFNQSIALQYSQFTLDSYSPDKYSIDKAHTDNVKQEMRANLE